MMTQDLHLIDFEFSVETGIDPHLNFYTAGFASLARTERDQLEFADDYFALGSALLGFFSANLVLIERKQSYAKEILQAMQRDIGLPQAFCDCVIELQTNPKPDLAALISKLETMDLSSIHAWTAGEIHIENLKPTAETMLRDIFSYMQSMLNLQNSPRILPLSNDLKSPFALDHGISGVLYAWHIANNQIPDDLLYFIRNKLSASGQLPGLLNGASGIAWVMSAIGERDISEKMLLCASEHPLLYQRMSLGYGATGYGMAQLHHWHRFGEQTNLDAALEIAEILLETAKPHENGLYWDKQNEREGAEVGLHHGSSGIALFLLYMYCASGRKDFLEAGEKALQFDLSCGKGTDESLSFPRYQNNPHRIVYPYISFGSAGIATVILRYWQVTGNDHYKTYLDRIKADVSSKYAVNCGLFFGTTGLGNYLLDAYQILGDASYRDLAWRLLDGIQLQEIKRDNGSVFPMLRESQVTTDYSTGSSGIGLFLHRLIHNGPNFNLMLDDLLTLPARQSLSAAA